MMLAFSVSVFPIEGNGPIPASRCGNRARIADEKYDDTTPYYSLSAKAMLEAWC